MSYQTNVNPWLQFTPQYQNKKNASLSYAVGGGVDFKLKNTGLRLGLGYRFSDLGKANLGKGNIDTASLPFTLKQAHLFTNQVIFQLTYLF